MCRLVDNLSFQLHVLLNGVDQIYFYQNSLGSYSVSILGLSQTQLHLVLILNGLEKQQAL